MSLGRREFLTFLSGAVAVLPLTVHAQQSATRVRRIGMLAQDLQPGLLEAFRNELQRLGYVDGANISIELRNAAGRNDRLATLAEELLGLKVEVIVAVNTPAAQAAKTATRAIPIVIMRVADPVKSGLVASLARPGGNVTGLSFMPDALGPKGVELLREILPSITRMAALYREDNAGAVVIVDEVIRKGEQLGLQFARVPVQDNSKDYITAFEIANRANSEALFVMDDGAITAHRQEVLDLAAKHALSVVSIYKDFAKSGGLIAYGPDLNIVYRRAAHFVDKLIKGERASDLPIEQPVIFDLVINLRAAKTLGITIPQTVLVRANEVIE
jgi:putative tryptophan/tyrosine transport system substrate-binding protein